MLCQAFRVSFDVDSPLAGGITLDKLADNRRENVSELTDSKGVKLGREDFA